MNIFMGFLNFAAPCIFEKEKMDKRCIDARSVKCEQRRTVSMNYEVYCAKYEFWNLKFIL